MKTVKAVAILGAGPSGLLAAHAARLSGYIPNIYTAADRNNPDLPWRSKIYGCQYLHTDIPGLNLRSTVVDYQLWGDPERYRTKVYGSEMAIEVSPSYLQGTHRAWDLRAAYGQLWAQYVEGPGANIVAERTIGPDDLEFLQNSWPTVISTIPAPGLCRNGHNFNSVQVFAMGDAPELGRRVPAELPEDTVICNGRSSPYWYRGSRVFGHGTLEWSGPVKPTSAVAVQKPVDSDCDCWPRVHQMGRYGKWQKGILTSDVFTETMKLLASL